MLVSKEWLQEYIDGELPSTDALVEILSLHAFEVEGVERKGDDDIIDIDILPNRAHDCFSHLGVAREIAVLIGTRFVAPEIQVETDASVSTQDALSLSVEDAKKVPRAMKRLVLDVQVGKSPDWLKNRLTAVGQKSINNVVDLTNFVMLETGQPVHAFDADKIEGDITIRGARKGEKVETLDGETYELEEGMLVIADSQKALDIAGIKGGAHSGIDENTTRLILSICNFDQTTIRTTSKKLGLITDASKRFGQGLTPELVGTAMERLSQLIHEVAGGRVAGDVLDEYPRKPNNYKVGVSLDEVNGLLGSALSEKEMTDIFGRLGFVYERIDDPRAHAVAIAPKYVGAGYGYVSTVIYDAPKQFSCSSFTNYLYVQGGIALPSISIDQYLYGEPIEESELSPGDLIFSKGEKPYIRDEVPEGVGHCGLYLGDGKVIHASGDKNVQKVIIEDYKTAPGFKELRGFRRVPTVSTPRFVVTIPHERLDLRIKQDLIEEVGRVYGYNNIPAQTLTKKWEPEVSKEFYYTERVRDILVREGFSEVYTYTFASEGDLEIAKPMNKEMPFLRTKLSKSVRDSLSQGVRQFPLLEQIRLFEIGHVFTSKDGEHLSLAIGISGDKVEGEINNVWNLLSEELVTNIRAPSYGGVSKVNLNKVLEMLPEPSSHDDIKDLRGLYDISYSSPSPYPFVLRDIAVWVPESVDAEELLEVIKSEAGELLVNTKLFDEYKNKKDGRVSYAYRLVFQSHDKTLSDEEVNAIMKSVEEVVGRKGWEVR